MTLTYLGHSAFYLVSGDWKVLIDPFLSGNPRSPKSVVDFPELSHILVTHGHHDHIGDTVQLARQTGALVVCNYELGHYFRGLGLEHVHTMHLGGRFEFLKMTPALHGSSIEIDGMLYDGGNPAGFLIEHDGKKIYHAGDTGLMMDMMLLKEERIDVALLPIGSNYTMDWQDALRAIAMIEPKKVIPMHYNTFDAIQVDTSSLPLPPDVTILFLAPGESIEV